MVAMQANHALADGHERTEALIAEIEREFPRFRLLMKRDSPSQRWLDRGLRVLTLGGQSGYLDQYHTTIGYSVYLADRWDEMDDAERYILLRHERIHLRQFRRYTRPGMAFLYLFVFFPLGLAWFRARFEQEAYAETLAATAEIFGPDALDAEMKEYVVEQFVGPAYAWMWPFRGAVERWYDRTVDELRRRSSQTSAPETEASGGVG